MPIEDELNTVTHKIYLYLVKVGEARGPRDVMHDIDLSSPAVAHRGLQKLVDLGLAQKDEYGRYTIKEKISFKGYYWVGKNLVHRLFLFGCFFSGLLVPEIIVLYNRWTAQETLGPYIFLTIITLLSSVIFLFEGWQLKRKT